MGWRIGLQVLQSRTVEKVGTGAPYPESSCNFVHANPFSRSRGWVRSGRGNRPSGSESETTQGHFCACPIMLHGLGFNPCFPTQELRFTLVEWTLTSKVLFKFSYSSMQLLTFNEVNFLLCLLGTPMLPTLGMFIGNASVPNSEHCFTESQDGAPALCVAVVRMSEFYGFS